MLAAAQQVFFCEISDFFLRTPILKSICEWLLLEVPIHYGIFSLRIIFLYSEKILLLIYISSLRKE